MDKEDVKLAFRDALASVRRLFGEHGKLFKFIIFTAVSVFILSDLEYWGTVFSRTWDDTGAVVGTFSVGIIFTAVVVMICYLINKSKENLSESISNLTVFVMCATGLFLMIFAFLSPSKINRENDQTANTQRLKIYRLTKQKDPEAPKALLTSLTNQIDEAKADAARESKRADYANSNYMAVIKTWSSCEEARAAINDQIKKIRETMKPIPVSSNLAETVRLRKEEEHKKNQIQELEGINATITEKEKWAKFHHVSEYTILMYQSWISKIAEKHNTKAKQAVVPEIGQMQREHQIEIEIASDPKGAWKSYCKWRGASCDISVKDRQGKASAYFQLFGGDFWAEIRAEEATIEQRSCSVLDLTNCIKNIHWAFDSFTNSQGEAFKVE